MLSSIHPFGERSRNNNFWTTVGAHITGSVLGGALLGLMLGTLGWLTTFVVETESSVRALIVVVAAVVAIGFEATSTERLLPSRLHQVNENWIQTYRGWVYGGGFGLELGFGLSTIITTSLVHVMVIVMVAIGSIPAATLIGAVFGLVRGLPLLAARRVETPEQLRHMHQVMAASQQRARYAGVAALAAAGAIGLTAFAW
ncbi:MAG: hypothetical protein HKN94_03215 [Acidimicrobiales bacterium]|nr:hypothetical protein [Acidimicrobiales bacterium]RZV42107.1 MAG: hypothetical protein EX269_15355 [Acidimicrobiales bacterium]